MAAKSEPPLLVICGPTASGKSELALKLAIRFGGEIICADSRTVYKGMDIGTAKPSRDDQVLVPYHLLDVVNPGELFTAYDFKQQATTAIKAIRQKNKLPLVVGGTGLYIDGLIFDYQFPPKLSPERYESLNTLSLEQLYKYCNNNSINLPQSNHNKRHIISAIRQHWYPIKRKKVITSNVIVVGIATERELLRQRIAKRAEHIFSHGVVREAKKLGKMYGWNNESMTANIYPIIHSYTKGELTLEEAEEKSAIIDWQLAKRQLTWLKRNPYIKWCNLADAEFFLTSTLAKFEQK